MHEKESHENETVSVNTSQLVIIGLAALFLMGAFQTWQLASTLSTINGMQAGSATLANNSAAVSQAQASAPANGGGTVPSNLVNLPSQVGGC